MIRLSNRQQRWLEGCFYLGCFTPAAFSILALMIAAKALADLLRHHA